MTWAPLGDQRRSPLDLLGNVQPVVGNFGAAGEQLLGEYPDLGAGSKFGLKVCLRWEFKRRGIFTQPQGLWTLHPLEYK
jgi:hypothetical protein